MNSATSGLAQVRSRVLGGVEARLSGRELAMGVVLLVARRRCGVAEPEYAGTNSWRQARPACHDRARDGNLNGVSQCLQRESAARIASSYAR